MLIVDWPSQDVPRTLIAGGFEVFSANLAAGTASRYSVGGSSAAQQEDGVEVLPPQRDRDPPLLITRIDTMPDHVDVVALYRPAEEHARIVQRAVDLGARTVWAQLGPLADDARSIAANAFLAVIEDMPIDEAIKELVTLVSRNRRAERGGPRYRVLRR